MARALPQKCARPGRPHTVHGLGMEWGGWLCRARDQGLKKAQGLRDPGEKAGMQAGVPGGSRRGRGRHPRLVDRRHRRHLRHSRLRPRGDPPGPAREQAGEWSQDGLVRATLGVIWPAAKEFKRRSVRGAELRGCRAPGLGSWGAPLRSVPTGRYVGAPKPASSPRETPHHPAAAPVPAPRRCHCSLTSAGPAPPPPCPASSPGRPVPRSLRGLRSPGPAAAFAPGSPRGPAGLRPLALSPTCLCYSGSRLARLRHRGRPQNAECGARATPGPATGRGARAWPFPGTGSGPRRGRRDRTPHNLRARGSACQRARLCVCVCVFVFADGGGRAGVW